MYFYYKFLLTHLDIFEQLEKQTALCRPQKNSGLFQCFGIFTPHANKPTQLKDQPEAISPSEHMAWRDWTPCPGPYLTNKLAGTGQGWCFVPKRTQGPAHQQQASSACFDWPAGGSWLPPFGENRTPKEATHQNKHGISAAASGFSTPKPTTWTLCKAGYPQTQIWITARRLGNHPGQ